MKNGLKNVLAAALAVLFVFSAAACSKKKSGGQPAEVAVNDHTEAPAATIPYTVDTEPPATPAPTPGPTAAPGETPYGTPKPTPEPLPDGYLTDWERTRLVNFRHRLADDYVPHDLVNAREFFGSVCDCKLDTTKIQLEVAVYAKLMFEAAAKEGVPHKYFLRNAYRTQSLQWEMWRERVSGSPYYGSDPYSYPVGTMPGNASEHCAGLALDIASLNYPNCDIGFGGTQEGKWLRDNAHRFGFILRYPEDKVHITGVHFEPWHFRYVGVELATEIHSRGICLEEYYGETPPTPVVTPRPSSTPRPTARPSSTPRPTVRPTATPRPTPWPTSSPTPGITPTPTPSPTPGVTPTPTPSPTPGVTPTPAPTPTPIPSPTSPTHPTPTPTPTLPPFIPTPRPSNPPGG